jgi:hypothetical protein
MFAMIANVACSRAEKSAAPAKPAANVAAGALDNGWPRLYSADGNEILVQLPQIDEWKDYSTLVGRVAVTVKLKGTEEMVSGVVELRGATATNHEERLVTLYRPEILAIRFPGATPETAKPLEDAVRSIPLVNDHIEIALDRVLAYVERSQLHGQGAQLNLEPPPIFYSDRDAILVSFLGTPRFQPIEGTSLEFGLNTNWDVIREPKSGRVYLLYRESWLATNDVMKGSWEPAGQLPADFGKLPKDDVWKRVSESVPGQPITSVPKVFVSDKPGEIIVTEGRPNFTPIPGTNLADVSNSENTLFYHQIDHRFYFLAAGRWFRAADLNGPWSAATKTLPADFASIPKDDPNSWVLASVPGTEEANDAVMLASIPKTGIVNRSEAKVEVIYDGEPKFEPIESTTVYYAVNTPNDVLRLGSTYYVCHEAVWFVGPSPTGPWTVTDVVPKEIYSIPPTSPKHNVTYVYVYDSTPTTVTCGHTSGYNGEIVAAGIVMFGLGMIVASNSPYYYYGYYPPYYWGYGPRPIPYYGHYHYYAGPHGYGWSAHGPYGGYGYGARYNPSTGFYTRGGYAYGPGGGSAWRTGYNPDTGVWAAQRGGYNAYGAWKQTAVVKGDEWARGGRYANSDGTIGGFQTSKGSGGIAYKGDEGSGYVVKGKNGNIYAGKDGNVYARGDNGEWQSANRSASTSATSASRPTPNTAQPTQSSRGGGSSGPTTATSDRKLSGGFGSTPAGTPSTASSASSGTTPRASERASGRPASYSNTPDKGVQESLNRDYAARQAGDGRARARGGSSTGTSGSRDGGGAASQRGGGGNRQGGGSRKP